MGEASTANVGNVERISVTQRRKNKTMDLAKILHLHPAVKKPAPEAESPLEKTCAIPSQREESEQHNSTQLKILLLVNGEVCETVVEDLDLSSGALTVFKNTVTTDQLKRLLETNSETYIEFVAVVTSTGTS